jgi:PEP-CTERM motif
MADMKLLLAAALTAFAAPAYAGSLTYDNYTWTGIGSISITSPNSIIGGAGPITLYEKGVVVVADAWCLDIDNYLAGSGTVGTSAFNLADAKSSPGVPSSLTATQLGVISWLVDIGDHTSDATLQGAIQVAIWSTEYSNFAYNSLGATFTTDVANDILAATADYTGHGDADAPGVFTLLVPRAGAVSQTLVYGSNVPEPSTWVTMGAGFALMGWVGWRRRDRVAALV